MFSAGKIGSALVACLVGLLVLASPALAESQLAVATFDNTQPEQPGSTVTRELRVSNLGQQAMDVRIEPRGVDLLDDGQTRFRDTQDPVWAGRITLSQTELSLAPRSTADVSMSIAIPADVAPDDYLLGVLVSPVPSGLGVRVVNAVGALVPLSIQGDRVRSLDVMGHWLPQLVIGDTVSGSVRVHNPGGVVTNAWVQADVNNALNGDQVATLQDYARTPVGPGTARDLTYTWHTGITAGLFRLPLRVSYNRDNSTTADIAVDEQVWVIHPLVLAAAVGLLVGLVVAGVRGHRAWRRRAARRTPAPSPVPAPRGPRRRQAYRMPGLAIQPSSGLAPLQRRPGRLQAGAAGADSRGN